MGLKVLRDKIITLRVRSELFAASPVAHGLTGTCHVTPSGTRDLATLCETSHADTILSRVFFMKTVFTARRLFTPIQEVDNALLVTADGRISEIASSSEKDVPSNSRVVEFGDAILIPGFFDIHMHGGAG